MFAYLSKKISVPNNANVSSICWDQTDGYIACGCEGNLLKVLKLESASGNEPRLRGLAAPSNLSTNQTLEGHTGAIRVVVWNERSKKLTSSDDNGLIIVWMVYKGNLYEEMINNRTKSMVRDMRWNHAGEKICISYEDGTVIVGSVDGNRIWGKDLSMKLHQCEWSPNGRLILFGSSDGEVHVFDNQGNKVNRVDLEQIPGELASIHWFNGRVIEAGTPVLAIIYRTGVVYLLKNETDSSGIYVETGIKATCARWSPDGKILAITGQQSMRDTERDREREVNVVVFYTNTGNYLRSVKLPGRAVTACSWEATGLRLALAIDSYIYFANIRPEYKWAYCTNTLAYAFNKTNTEEQFVMFWNIRKNLRQIRPVRQLYRMTGGGDFCCLACRSDDPASQYALFLCNALGISMDTRYTDLEPLFLTMTRNNVICASKEAFYVWQYLDPNRILLLERQKTVSEKLYHIDETPSGIGSDTIDMNKIYKTTDDPIVAVGASDTLLLIGRQSGTINCYSLPQVALIDKFVLTVRPARFSLNAQCTKVTILDTSGVLMFYNLETKSVEPTPAQMDAAPAPTPAPGAKGGAAEQQATANTASSATSTEKKDVWDMMWAEDNNTMFTCLEKTKLCVLRDEKFEEPVLTSGYICSFSDLQVRVAMLDEILRTPEEPNPEYILNLEIKILRDARELLRKGSLTDVQKFVESNSHAKLWKLLADAALEKGDLKMAEHAFVRCRDYSGIKFVQHLERLQNDRLRKGEVEAYFERFDSAEQMFRAADRLDLAVALRKKLGDWTRVVSLLKADSGGGNDRELEAACTALGEFHAERQQWQQAVTYLQQAHNAERLVECYFMLEDYASLEQAANALPNSHKMLPEVGQMFQGVGLCDQAVTCYVRAGKIREAVDCCIQLNSWSKAVQLAEQHGLSDVPLMLPRLAQQMIEQNRIISATELFRRAEKFLDAAKLLFRCADRLAASGASPMLLKKIYVLAALLVERHHERIKDQQRTNSGGTAGRLTAGMSSLASAGARKTSMQTAVMGSARLSVTRSSMQSVAGKTIDPTLSLAGLLAEDAAVAASGVGGDARLIDNAWRGAEAYHFMILAHNHLYKGDYDAAHRTALLLRDYEDFIGSFRLYSLIALTAAASRNYASCSSSFLRLESLGADQLPSANRQQIEELAVEIFVRRPPKDTRVTMTACPSCDAQIPDWSSSCPSCFARFPVCVVSGRPLYHFQFWVCGTCKHRAYEQEIRRCVHCPLCHTAV